MTEPSALDLANRIASDSYDGKACITPDLSGEECRLIVAALRAAPVQGEPVAWRYRRSRTFRWTYTEEKPSGPSIHLFEVEPIYAALQSSPALRDAPPDTAAELHRLSSLWEDERIRHNVYKDYFELAHVIDILLGRIPRL